MWRSLPKRLSPLFTVLVGMSLFAFVVIFSFTALPAHWSLPARQWCTNAILIGSSVLMMLWIHRPASVWGVRRPQGWTVGTIVPTVLGGVLGAGSTAALLGLDLQPMIGAGDLDMASMILAIWVGSTLAEEIFVRGLLQGWMQPIDLPEGRNAGGRTRILVSGGFFGAMHLVILFGGTPVGTATLILASTTALGLICAWTRERSGSLVGPLLAHLAFNVCGVLGAMVIMGLRGPVP